MYSKEGHLVDRREMLKVKAKSLAEEARIIRQEERKAKGQIQVELSWHRRSDVRHAARTTYMAYGLIRGRAVDRTERPGSERSEVYWKAVKTMIQKYGPVDKAANEAMQGACKA